MYRTILMPTDGSPCSFQALEHGLSLAKALGAKVHFLYVLENPAQAIWIAPESVPYGLELLEDLKKAGEEAIRKALDLAREKGVEATGEVKEGTPIPTIVEAAKGFDLLVMGTHGRTGLDKLLLGSVTEGVLHRVSVPVLVVRCR
ncbi:MULTISPECIES: universal stress protein [Thermus]|jgi:nucleotide-binding universal stress UspA family protein|uniref:Universal stress protein n=1 Tax=Thermus brockianus TaxID=56956 RepID=A0A1J0LTI5_THEBO|nr:universal stress protein [Thermus brockianus]APD08995.1 universal stress protein UspA-like protein [Thermus brockianus]BDG15575.1 universal stress protein [Thermus brockianus]